MRLREINWRYLTLRLSETSSWISINAFLLGLGVAIPDATFHQWQVAAQAMATLAGVILPQIGKPITTDVGAARQAAGLPLTGFPASAPIASDAGKISVSLAGIPR